MTFFIVNGIYRMNRLPLIINTIKPGFGVVLFVLIILALLTTQLIGISDNHFDFLLACSLMIFIGLGYLLSRRIEKAHQHLDYLQKIANEGEIVEGRVSGHTAINKNTMILTYTWWDQKNKRLHDSTTNKHPNHRFNNYTLGEPLELRLIREPKIKIYWIGDLKPFINYNTPVPHRDYDKKLT